jgi:mannose-6-phosphate isomerase-like protein (cupin superfamily)
MTNPGSGTRDGRLRFGISPYLDWVAGEGVPFVDDFAVDLLHTPVGTWDRFGASGAVINVKGRGDYLDLWLLELAAAASTVPVQHLFEVIVYVISGHGSTSIEVGGEQRAFEWGPGSMFALPLNGRYQFFNSSGRAPARLAMTTAFPITMNLLHNDAFIFGADYDFRERLGSAESFGGNGKSVTDHDSSLKYELWETNFVPDLGAFAELKPLEWRGTASTSVMFLLADGVLHAHMSEIPTGRYKKAHRHMGGTHIYPVNGRGYSLLWWEGEEERIRVDWEHGWVYSPPDNMYHQHFNLADQPSRYFAVKFGNHRYPVTARMSRQFNATEESMRKSRDQINYEDEDPSTGALYRAELARAHAAVSGA